MANERWSSDANYPAGADPWATTPTKVAPDAGTIAAGHSPAEVTPAQRENWWKNRTDARLEAAELEANTRWQVAMIGTNQTANVDSFTTGGGTTPGYGVHSSAPAAYTSNVCTIDLRPGDKITELKAQALGTGAAQNVTVKLYRIKSDISGVDLVGTVTIVDPPLGVLEATQAIGPAFEVEDGDAFFWRIDIPLANSGVVSMGITKSRPAA